MFLINFVWIYFNVTQLKKKVFFLAKKYIYRWIFLFSKKWLSIRAFKWPLIHTLAGSNLLPKLLVPDNSYFVPLRTIETRDIYIKLITGWVKQKCDLQSLVQSCTFFATLLYGVFSIFSENLYFFGTPMAQKKIRESFFSQNQKFRKAKMCIKITSIEI